RALGCEQPRVLAADAAAGTGDDHRFALEPTTHPGDLLALLRRPAPRRKGAVGSPLVNDSANEKVYIHEFIDIIGHNRANYMHHMTANFSPMAQDERHQLCYGVWGVVGTTRGWPEVVNIWEEDGFPGLSRSFEHEFNHPSLQDPKLAKWWSEAANYRRHGDDRVLIPAPWMPTIEQLCAAGTSGETYAHEQVHVP